MERTQFTFYESFYRALSLMRSAESKAEAYDAICRYALYGDEPNVDEISETAAMVFELVKPNLDASRRKAESGKTGGARSKSEANESKPKQTESKKEKENKKENEIEYKCNPPAPLQKPKKQPKVQFAENVAMTNAEYQSLLDTHGEANTKRLIEILDNHKGATGRKYVSDYRAILSWCVDKLNTEKARPISKGPTVSRPETPESPADYMRRMDKILEASRRDGES